jgi:carboxynorspermidine decarboxylase
VYLEPGEAIALNAGILVGTVVDIFKSSENNFAVLDISATTHMPDVLEMPYQPAILNGGFKDEYTQKYHLVGPSCLTGDVIGQYSFEKPLVIGQKIIFLNMAIYTMVKNNTFNGVNLPSIAKMDKKGKIKIIKKFGYKDFKERLS